ncbi:unnamed protein product [Discula destructiva]
MIVTFLVAVCQTLPVQAQWNPNVAITHTIDLGDFATATASITIFGDILVLCIPLWLFTGLQMRSAVKLGLLTVFLLSGMVTAVGITRLAMFRIAWTDRDKLDYWDSWGPALGQIESALAIITACIPTLRPVVATWMPSILASEPDYGSADFLASRTFGGGTMMPRAGRRASAVSDAFELHRVGRARTTIRSHSTYGSEDGIVASNNMMKKTQVDVSYNMETMSAMESSQETCKD